MVISSPEQTKGFRQIIHSFMNGLLWLEPLWIACLAPSILLRDSFWDPWVQPWLLAALFLFWPLRLLYTKRLAPPTPLNWPLLLLLLWSPVGVWVSAYPQRSWDALGYLVLGLTLCFALLNWPLTQRYPWLIVVALGGVGLALAATGPALLANIPQKVLILSDDFMQSKPIDLFGLGETINSNVLAGALLIPIPLLFAFAIRWDWVGRPLRYWLAPLLGLLALGILATSFLAQSRGAYLAMLVSLLVLVLLRWPRFWLVLAAAGLAIGLVLVWQGTVLFDEPIGSNGSVTTLSGRNEVWARGFYALRDAPVTGIGIGTFGLLIPQLYPYSAANLNQPDVIPHAHNLLLQVGDDLGVPGLFFYGWLWVSAFGVLIGILRRGGKVDEDEMAEEQGSTRRRHRLRRLRKRRTALRWALAAGVLASLCGIFVHGLVDAVTWGTKVAFMPWLLFALTALLALPPTPLSTMAQAETNLSEPGE